MARYIDAEKLCKDLMDMARYQPIDKQSTIVGIVSTIKHFSTADVVPRVEVEKLHEVIFKKEDLMQKIAEERNKYADELEVVKDTIEHLKAEVAREIFKDLDEIAETDGCVYYLYSTELTELEKKYTEGHR